MPGWHEGREGVVDVCGHLGSPGFLTQLGILMGGLVVGQRSSEDPGEQSGREVVVGAVTGVIG